MTRPNPAVLRRAALFAGLADPIRLAILAQVIAQPDITNMEVTAACGLGQSQATYHLARLERAGLVVREKRATYAHYTAAPLAEQLLAFAEEGT